MPMPPVVGIDYKDKDVGNAIVFECTGKELYLLRNWLYCVVGI